MNYEILEDMFYYHNKYRNVDIHSIGCELSTWDVEHIIDIVGSPNEEIMILNTCAVTERAEKASKSVATILRSIYPNKKFYITGCGVDYDREFYENWCDKCLGNYEKFDKANYPKMGWYGTFKHNVNTDTTFIKVQDGCANNCTYCAVKLLRNKPYSVPYKEIQYQINSSIANKRYKLHIIGTEITNYYSDGMYIDGLIRRILEDYPQIESISFNALDPSSKRVEFLIDMIKNDKRFEKTLYLSVQSGSDRVLKHMKRRYDIKRVEELCDYANGLNIDMDLIVGYPEETDEDLELTKKLVQKYNVREVYVCPFSRRKGTEAYTYQEKYTRQEKLQRARELYVNSGLSKKLYPAQIVYDDPKCEEIDLYSLLDVVKYVNKIELLDIEDREVITNYVKNNSGNDYWEVLAKILTLCYGVKLYVRHYHDDFDKSEFCEYNNCILVEDEKWKQLDM